MGVVLTVTITTQLRGAREHSCSVGTYFLPASNCWLQIKAEDEEGGEKVKLIESGN